MTLMSIINFGLLNFGRPMLYTYGKPTPEELMKHLKADNEWLEKDR